MWGAQTGDGFIVDGFWASDIATDEVEALGLVPEQPSSDEGVCKISCARNVTALNGVLSDIAGMGIWWDGAGVNGKAQWIKARRVVRSVVNFEIDFGPMEATDIYAEDCANPSALRPDDVERAAITWPQTPHVYIARATLVRCGNGIATTSSRHNVNTNGGCGKNADEFNQLLGIYDTVVEDCDLSEIEGGTIYPTRYAAGWRGGVFSVDGWTSRFEQPVYRNNLYNPASEFRAGDDYPLSLSEWRALGMS
jgi:hypothetical protein